MTTQEEVCKYIIESIPYKGWLNTYAGKHKISFKKVEETNDYIELGQECSQYSFDKENWLEDAWLKFKKFVDGTNSEQEYDGD
jgi:hypothetical protein